jgi:hypothetical protein
MVRTIRIGLSRPDAGDVLDYATALIEEYGWNQMKPTDSGDEMGPESSPEVGYTLHSAIGEACQRLSAAVSGSGRQGSKDWTVYSEQGQAENLRQRATALVQAHLPAGETDMTFNDKAKDVQEILDVLAHARADVPTMEVPV